MLGTETKRTQENGIITVQTGCSVSYTFRHGYRPSYSSHFDTHSSRLTVSCCCRHQAESGCPLVIPQVQTGDVHDCPWLPTSPHAEPREGIHVSTPDVLGTWLISMTNRYKRSSAPCWLGSIVIIFLWKSIGPTNKPLWSGTLQLLLNNVLKDENAALPLSGDIAVHGRTDGRIQATKCYFQNYKQRKGWSTAKRIK